MSVNELIKGGKDLLKKAKRGPVEPPPSPPVPAANAV